MLSRACVIAILILQTAPAPAPRPVHQWPVTWLPVTAEDTLTRPNYPVGWDQVGADLANLEKVMAHVRAGILPGEPAQTPPATITIEPGTAIRLEWTYTHNAFRPVKFRLWLDGVILKNFVTADLTTSPLTHGSTVTVSTNADVVPAFTPQQLGTRTLALTAYDAAGTGGTASTESKREDASLVVEVAYTSPPPAPGGFKLITIKLAQLADGSMRFISATTEEK